MEKSLYVRGGRRLRVWSHVCVCVCWHQVTGLHVGATQHHFSHQQRQTECEESCSSPIWLHTHTHSNKLLQFKATVWARTGGKIGHLLIGNAINSPVTKRHAIIFISSWRLWGSRREEAVVDFLLRVTQIQLCVLSHDALNMLALKALVWVFWRRQDVHLGWLPMALQSVSLYSPWTQTNRRLSHQQAHIGLFSSFKILVECLQSYKVFKESHSPPQKMLHINCLEWLVCRSGFSPFSCRISVKRFCIMPTP